MQEALESQHEEKPNSMFRKVGVWMCKILFFVGCGQSPEFSFEDVLNITWIIIPIDMTSLIGEMDPCKLFQAL
jgi:hypothetical protein